MPLVSLQNDCYWQAERLRSNDSLRSTEFASELVAARLTAERLLLAALLLTKKKRQASRFAFVLRFTSRACPHDLHDRTLQLATLRLTRCCQVRSPGSSWPTRSTWATSRATWLALARSICLPTKAPTRSFSMCLLRSSCNVQPASIPHASSLVV